MNSKGKGSGFERSICRDLSLWWSLGDSDCLFWRTASSGGRATTRAKKGKETAGSYGDICATDSRGADFIKAFVIEAKKGYNRFGITDLLDKAPKSALQNHQKWFNQANESRIAGGSLYWMIISKRDQRQTLAHFPTEAFSALADLGSFQPYPITALQLVDESQSVTVMRLADFFDNCDPEHIRKLIHG